MTRFLLSLILLSPIAVVGCDSPRSLQTAQMAPAIMPISQPPQAEADPINHEMGQNDNTSTPTTASVMTGRR